MEAETLGIETKKLMSDEIKKKIAACGDLFVASFHKISVADQDQLRQKLAENEAAFSIVKNRIAQRALKESNREQVAGLLKGPSAIAFSRNDCLAVSKTLVEFAKKNETFEVRGGYVDGQILDGPAIAKLALIPSKAALLAQIVGGFKAPIQGLINTLTASIRNFVVVIDKIRENKK
ncbi:50S ribosomal protein L10 [Candidatus Omnitrophota bacterium]